MSSNFMTLSNLVVSKSKANIFSAACKEWEIDKLEILDQDDPSDLQKLWMFMYNKQ